MSDLREPARWLESGGLSAEHLGELRAYAREAPSPERRARMLEQLTSQLAEPPAPGLLVKPATLVKLGLLGAALLVGVVALLQPRPQGSPWLAASELAVGRPERVAPLAQTQLATATERPEAEVARPASPAARTPRERAPRATASVPVSRAPEVASARGETNVLGELAMLARARRALLNDPARALELSDAHARSHPQGTFAEEREVLAIEALLKLGQTRLALAREREFEARFPRSVQIAHLRATLQEPAPRVDE